MSTEVTLPELGENIATGDLVKLLVKPGDHVEKDQPIIELETDKATIEVPSPSSGTVSQVHVKEGEKLKVGQAILSLDGDGGNGAGRKQAEAPKVERPRAEGKRSPESTVMSKSAEPAQQAEQRPKTSRQEPAKQEQQGAKAPAAKSSATGTQQVTLPELGENITSGDLVKILVKVGDRIEQDQPLIELETDKATVEVPSPAAGTVTEILVKQGQNLKVGQPILSLSGSAAGAPAESKAQRRQPEETVMTKSAEP